MVGFTQLKSRSRQHTGGLNACVRTTQNQMRTHPTSATGVARDERAPWGLPILQKITGCHSAPHAMVSYHAINTGRNLTGWGLVLPCRRHMSLKLIAKPAIYIRKFSVEYDRILAKL